MKKSIYFLLLTALLLATSTNPIYTFPVPLGGLNIQGTYRIYAGLTVAAGGTNIAIAINAVGGDY